MQKIDIAAARQKLQQSFSSVRKHTQLICADLATEDFVAQPAIFVSPPKWHLAHTTWFFETFILSPFKATYKAFHPKYAYVFNSYYQHAGERVKRDIRGALTRPAVQDIIAYRAYVNEAVEELITQISDQDFSQLFERISLGLQHEKQHQELLVYDIKYILGKNPLFPKANVPLNALIAQDASAGKLSVSGGVFPIGYEGNGFHFDNEKPTHKSYITDFEIDKALVTNEMMLEFIEAGGYTNFAYWLDEGWSWVQEQGIYAPEYWQEIEGKWHLYRLNEGLTAVDPNMPLMHISFYEADAIARFFKADLPSEFEREIVWENLENNGLLWEWSGSAYRPYPGFKAIEGALGEYNGKFMVNQMVLKGGSIATPTNHLRPTYRNFFHADERWMFSGIRFIYR
jgi:ergothioneine biosynthesis protein EgtB